MGVKRSIDITPETYEALKKIAGANNMPVSELIRNYIDKGMNVDKTKSDIDFIRKNIREEVEAVMKPQINRLAKLLMRIGMMTVSFCYFTSKIIFHFVPFKDRQSYEELMREAKHSSAAYLNMRDETLENAFREFNEDNK